MIAYDDLVAALASWRTRQGLPAGEMDYLGAAEPIPVYRVPHPSPDDVVAAHVHASEEVHAAEAYVEETDSFQEVEDDYGSEDAAEGFVVEGETSADEEDFSEAAYDAETQHGASIDYSEEGDGYTMAEDDYASESALGDADEHDIIEEDFDVLSEEAHDAETVDVAPDAHDDSEDDEDAEVDMNDEALEARTVEINEAEADTLYAEAETTVIAEGAEGALEDDLDAAIDSTPMDEDDGVQYDDDDDERDYD